MTGRGDGGSAFAEDLRDALALAAAAGTIGSPVEHDRLLKAIVETAAHVISAKAGSLFLIDEASGDMFFEVATGPKAEEVKKFRVPIGSGIAGLVAASGQAIAVSDATHDPNVLKEIGDRIGYKPETILCVPLFFSDRVIGVLELLDKQPSFTAADMEALALFANQAAIAIELSRTYKHLGPLVLEILSAAGGGGVPLRDRARRFSEEMEGDPAFARTLNLAELVREIAWEGETEAEACRAILQGFADYLGSRRRGIGR